MSATYAVMAIIAVALLAGYCILVPKKEFWLLLLFVCVTVINTGYFLISVADTLVFAIVANDMVYIGSIFLSMCMLLTIVKLCGFEVRKKLVVILTGIGVLMFAIVATSGILPWYYKEVSLIFIESAAKLKKVYGILHPTYLIYQTLYFSAMIVCIIQSVRKKMIASQKYAVLMTSVVFGNIVVWFIEKFIPWNFEFLSVFYLFSEIIFLALYWMMQDYIRADLVPLPQPETMTEAIRPVSVDIAIMPIEEKISKVLSCLNQGELLSPREREILELILQNKKRKDIAVELHLSENTIKTHTRTLYGKLGVKSREELYLLLIQ